MKKVIQNEANERFLIESLTSQDYTAYHELYRIFGNDLFRYALKRVGDAKSAAQVVEDLFEKLWLDRSFVELSPPLYTFFISELDKELTLR